MFDLFGIAFDGHPDLRRILMPDDWAGHPLRKDYPVQIRKDTASWSPLQMTRGGVRGEHPRQQREQASRVTRRAPAAIVRTDASEPRDTMPEIRSETMTVNMGPQHPSTHGVLRLVLELDGENIVSVDPTIGFLHTGIEKTAEQKKWQQVDPARRADGLPRVRSRTASRSACRSSGCSGIETRFRIASSGSAC